MGTNFVMALFILIFVIATTVAISRWIFRINDIIARLDKIVGLLESQKGEAK